MYWSLSKQIEAAQRWRDQLQNEESRNCMTAIISSLIELKELDEFKDTIFKTMQQ